MLRSADDLEACRIQSNDGDLGDINDLYFDDEAWVIRYLVVATSHWFFKREALISPIALTMPDWTFKTLHINLSQQQIDESPDICVHEPVSRQQEYKYFGYYGYPIYWGGNGLWGMGLYPEGLMPENIDINGQSKESLNPLKADAFSEPQNNDPHLRSWQEVKGYLVKAVDGDIGHILDLLIDDQTFAIRYFVVKTNHEWGGNEVLIAPQWFSDLSWADSSVMVKYSREAIKQAPSYEPNSKMHRYLEIEMHKHYGSKGYWLNELGSSQPPI